MTDDRLAELARLYAAGEVTWREIAAERDDVAFGDLLLELARQGLALPQAEARRTPEQQTAWEAALRRAAEQAGKVAPVVKSLFSDGELEWIDVHAWPQLRSLGWFRGDRRVRGAEALAMYERNWRFVDEAQLTPAERALIEALAWRHGGGKLNITAPPWGGSAGQNDDEKLARTKAIAEQWSDKHWPALAALAHELPEDQRPSNSAAIWISVPAPGPMPPTPDIGKWCIVREAAEIDGAWELVRAAVIVGKIWSAKVSGARQAARHGGTHLICAYVPDSGNLDDVRRARAVLRELGFAEELGYKTDAATAAGVYGSPGEWMLRE